MPSPIRLSVPSGDLPAFAFLVDRQASDLAKLCDALNSTGGPLLHLEQVEELLEVQGVAPESLRVGLARLLVTFATLQRVHALSAEGLFDAIGSALDNKEEWSGEQGERWNQLKPQIIGLMSHETLLILDKVYSLHYEYAHVVHRSRVLTDVRPVFSGHGDEPGTPRAAVVSHTLELSYSDGDRLLNLTLALDQESVEKLGQQCQRATRKAVDLKALLGAGISLPTVVAGEEWGGND